MKIIKKIIILIVVIALLIVGLLGYLGFFDTIDIREGEVGPFTFVYEEYIGDYAKTGPVFKQIYNALLSDGVESSVGLGIYYDDPKVVLKNNLRSKVGYIVTEEEAEIADKRGNPHKIMTVDIKNGVITEFPYRNSLSVMAGVIKVYPAIQEYMKLHDYSPETSIMEIYDIENGKIVYFMEITD